MCSRDYSTTLLGVMTVVLDGMLIHVVYGTTSICTRYVVYTGYGLPRKIKVTYVLQYHIGLDQGLGP